jgi:uncharacterized coiled-coil DUF342 family protein
MALKEEIFEQNSTLFQVLDENEVTGIGAISTRVDTLSDTVDEYKLQLDGLALRVDTNQSRNEQMFVQINTQLVQDRNDIDTLQTTTRTLTTTVDSLSQELLNFEGDTETRFTDVYQRINTTTDDINALSTEVSTLSDQVDTLIADFESQQDEIGELQENIISLTNEQQSLTNRVTQLEQRRRGGDNIIYGDILYMMRFEADSPAGAIVTMPIKFLTEIVEYGTRYDCVTTTASEGYLTFSATTPINQTGIPVQLGAYTTITGVLPSNYTATNKGCIVYYNRTPTRSTTESSVTGHDRAPLKVNAESDTTNFCI